MLLSEIYTPYMQSREDPVSDDGEKSFHHLSEVPFTKKKKKQVLLFLLNLGCNVLR